MMHGFDDFLAIMLIKPHDDSFEIKNRHEFFSVFFVLFLCFPRVKCGQQAASFAISEE